MKEVVDAGTENRIAGKDVRVIDLLRVGSPTTQLGDIHKKSKREPSLPFLLPLDDNVVKWFKAIYSIKSTRIHKVYKDEGTLEIKGPKMMLKDKNGKASVKLK